MKRILVQGASSAIAQALCRKFALAGASYCLLGRDQQRLQAVAEDLKVRGAAKVDFLVVGQNQSSELAVVMEKAVALLGGVDLFLSAQGMLPCQDEVEKFPEQMSEIFRVNVVELMQASLLMAHLFESQGSGTCIIIGSVAGDRGRRSNYIYGSGKAALETFCDGLRQRLEPKARVLLVKPGPVDTPMTAHLAKGILFTTAEHVAEDILRSLQGRQKVLYTPFYWRGLMFLISRLPDAVVKRLRA
jgi:decaprenylphospho-beta-D-erythro-pentofuranosid-2-ulose 2-reductase